MSSSRLVVVGSINRDEAIRMPSLPGPGETSIGLSSERGLGGKGANQAVAAARAGADVALAGAVGSDAADLLSRLTEDGVDVARIIRIADAGSGRAIILIDDAAENSIVVVPGANALIPEATVDAACADLGPGDVLVLQNEVPTAISARAATRASGVGAVVIWNAAPAPRTVEQLVPGVDVLVVNEGELRQIAAVIGLDDGASDPDAMVVAVADRLRADVVCTLGAAGAAFQLEGVNGVLPAPRVTAVDTTAAGDTFVGYFAAHAGLPPQERVRIALAAGSLAVTRPGAAASIPHRMDVEENLDAPTERNRA